MEKITSRKNPLVQHFRSLQKDRSYRYEKKEFVVDGIKMLKEAISSGAEISNVLYSDRGLLPAGINGNLYEVSEEILHYSSPLENSPGPVFSVKMQEIDLELKSGKIVVLEDIQDPGNIGTVLRTASALGTDLIVLCGNCADAYNPKTVRATMGAIFRQKFVHMELDGLCSYLQRMGLPLYGAALDDASRSIREISMERCAVAIGNEGHGLSDNILSRCDKKIIIPMTPDSESLNAAIAAAIVMWEMNNC